MALAGTLTGEEEANNAATTRPFWAIPLGASAWSQSRLFRGAGSTALSSGTCLHILHSVAFLLVALPFH